MPDGGPELTLITPGRVGRGAGGRPPRAGVGLTTAVILHPRTPVPSPRRGRTRPHRTGAGLTGDKAAITADRLALIAPGSDLSASARGCGSGPLVLRLVPALTSPALSAPSCRSRPPGHRLRREGTGAARPGPSRPTPRPEPPMASPGEKSSMHLQVWCSLTFVAAALTEGYSGGVWVCRVLLIGKSFRGGAGGEGAVCGRFAGLRPVVLP